MGKDNIMIKVKIPEFSYGNKKVLSNINLTLDSGLIHSIVGDNGAGKSTLLHIMAGAIKPNNKNIIIEHDFKKIMCSFQNPIILNRSVYDNLKHTADILKIKNSDKKIKSALKDMGLTKVSNIPAPNLSGGQKMRLQIARLILSGCDFWILDEPFSGLDKEACDGLIQILKKYNKKGTTILITSHNNMADKISKSKFVFANGKLTAVVK